MNISCDDVFCNNIDCLDVSNRHYHPLMSSREPTPEQRPATIERKPLFFDRIFQKKLPPPPPSSPPMFDLPPLAPIELKGYGLSRQVLDNDLAQDIRQLVPARLQLEDQWQLVYSLDHDGVLLNTLYRHCEPNYTRNHGPKREAGFGESVVTLFIGQGKVAPVRPQGYVVVIRDNHHNRFGCFLNENLHQVDSKRYYGNGECFLWKVEPVDEDNNRFKAFMYTGVNDNIIYSNSQFIAVGSLNGENGLYIDGLLDYGVSYRCDTFGNEVLNHRNDFDKMGRFTIIGLEIWRIG